MKALVSRRTLLGGLALAGIGSTGEANAAVVSVPDDQASFYPNGAVPTNANKVVIAHWHWFRRSIDNGTYPDLWQKSWLTPAGEGGKHLAYGGYCRNRPIYRAPLTGSDWMLSDLIAEMTLAKRMGIDAFMVNSSDASIVAGSLTEQMIAAAVSVGNFKVCLSIDCDGTSGKTAADIAKYFNTYKAGSRILKHTDGRVIVSCFRAEAWSLARWNSILAMIPDAFFLPTFVDPAKIATYDSIIDGLSLWWGNDYRYFTSWPQYDDWHSAMVSTGREFMPCVWPQDHRPNQQIYWEARGSRTARAGWEKVISSAATRRVRYVQMVSWNDYTEGTSWQPSTASQFAYADLARYYISWLKAGTRPAIVRDVLYYFHRIESPTNAATGTLQTVPRFVEKVGEPANVIELVAFLTAPGTIAIDTTHYSSVGAGIQVLTKPFYVGRPIFRLIRNDTEVIRLQSNFTSRASSDYQDLLYRAGGSSRSPVLYPPA